MFGIGMPEMLLILAVALIVFGPKRLPELAKSLGRALGEFKRATNDLKQSIETDTGLDDIKKDIKSQVNLDDQPTPSPADSADQAAESDEPLGRVKAAFDKMNDEAAPAADAEAPAAPESEADPSPDPDVDAQEKATP
jgi:sec-independent protein translocase protein TatB